jgi:hypothetical protein
MNPVVVGGFIISVACPLGGLIFTHFAYCRSPLATRLFPVIPHLFLASPILRFTRMMLALSAFAMIFVVHAIHTRLSRRNFRENGRICISIDIAGSVFAFALAGLVSFGVNRNPRRSVINFTVFSVASGSFHALIDGLPRQRSLQVTVSRALGVVMTVTSFFGCCLFVACSYTGKTGAAYLVAAACQYVAFVVCFIKLGLLGFAVVGPRSVGKGQTSVMDGDPFAYRLA